MGRGKDVLDALLVGVRFAWEGFFRARLDHGPITIVLHTAG
jgi:hypothetical protein